MLQPFFLEPLFKLLSFFFVLVIDEEYFANSTSLFSTTDDVKIVISSSVQFGFLFLLSDAIL